MTFNEKSSRKTHFDLLKKRKLPGEEAGTTVALSRTVCTGLAANEALTALHLAFNPLRAAGPPSRLRAKGWPKRWPNLTVFDEFDRVLLLLEKFDRLLAIVDIRSCSKQFYLVEK